MGRRIQVSIPTVRGLNGCARGAWREGGKGGGQGPHLLDAVRCEVLAVIEHLPLEDELHRLGVPAFLLALVRRSAENLHLLHHRIGWHVEVNDCVFEGFELDVHISRNYY